MTPLKPFDRTCTSSRPTHVFLPSASTNAAWCARRSAKASLRSATAARSVSADTGCPDTQRADVSASSSESKSAGGAAPGCAGQMERREVRHVGVHV